METAYRGVWREQRTVRLHPLVVEIFLALGTDFYRIFETHLVLKLATPPSHRMHSLASSIPWLNATPKPSCAPRHRCSTPQQGQNFVHQFSLTSLSSPLQQSCCMSTIMSELPQELVRQVQRWARNGRDNVPLAVQKSIGSVVTADEATSSNYTHQLLLPPSIKDSKCQKPREELRENVKFFSFFMQDAMSCVARVPRQKSEPQDGPWLCIFELIDLVVLPYIFCTFPYLCAHYALCKSRLTQCSFNRDLKNNNNVIVLK